MRSQRILIWSTATFLTTIMVALLKCASLDDHSGGPSASTARQTQSVDVGGQEADHSISQDIEHQMAGANPESLPESEHDSQGDSEPVNPADLSAGSVLTQDDINRAGGIEAFFWGEPIPDEVFARMEGASFGSDCTVARSDLRYVRVLHVDAEGTIKVGELVVHRNLTEDVLDIFRQLYYAGYPIKKMHLIDDYGGSDDASCADDNTSSFNYRLVVGGPMLSNHAYGIAIDINPYENPYCIPAQGYVSPAEATRYADRSLREPYMIHTDDFCYRLFIAHGWEWGGDWPTLKDYQHFEKPGAQWQ